MYAIWHGRRERLRHGNARGDMMRSIGRAIADLKVTVETNAQIDDTLDLPALVVPALVGALGDRLQSVVLFGSRARGDHYPESDWDLLVIAELLPTRPLERYREIKSALPPGTRGATAVLATTPQEFEGHLPEIYLDIALDGQILYDQVGYAAERLAELRRIMDRSGLYRERTPAGDIWQWRLPPAHPWSIEWER